MVPGPVPARVHSRDLTRPSASAGLPRPCRRRRRVGRAGLPGRPAPGRRSASARASRRGSTRSMTRLRAWVSCSTRCRQRSTKACAESRSSRITVACASAAFPAGPAPAAATSSDRAAEIGDRVTNPAQLHVLAIDDVLIGVVEVVIGDEACAGDVALLERGLVAIELAKQFEQCGRFHAFCFSLQVMQTRVQGMALRRAGAIGSPQSRQTP